MQNQNKLEQLDLQGSKDSSDGEIYGTEEALKRLRDAIDQALENGYSWLRNCVDREGDSYSIIITKQFTIEAKGKDD